MYLLTCCLGRATLALPILLDRLVRHTVRLVGPVVAAYVLLADRAALFQIVCAHLRQANSGFDVISLRARKGQMCVAKNVFSTVGHRLFLSFRAHREQG